MIKEQSSRRYTNRDQWEKAIKSRYPKAKFTTDAPFETHVDAIDDGRNVGFWSPVVYIGVISSLDSYRKITYKEYCAALDGLAEGRASEIAFFGMDFFSKIAEIIKEVGEQFKIGVKELIAGLKQRDVFRVLKGIGFNLKALMKGLMVAGEVVKHGFFEIIHELERTKAIQKLREGALTLDEILKKHPVLKRLTGPAIAGLLLWMWLSMSFVGHPHTDLDISHIIKAFHGGYSIHDLFTSDSGLLASVLLVIGKLTPISFPWLSNSVYNLLLALVYTGYRKIKANREFMQHLHNLIPAKKVPV